MAKRTIPKLVTLFLTLHKSANSKENPFDFLKTFTKLLASSCSIGSIIPIFQNQSGMGVMGRPTRFDSIHDSIDIFDSYTAPSGTRPQTSHESTLDKDPYQIFEPLINQSVEANSSARTNITTSIGVLCFMAL